METLEKGEGTVEHKHTISFGLRTVLVCLAVVGPGCKPKQNLVAEGPPSAVRAQFPLPIQFPIVVPVKFREVEYRFILDTGCSVTSFNGKHKNLLGDYVKTYTSSGALWQSTPMDAYTIPDDTTMQMGPIRIKGEVGAMDYASLGDWLTEYDGLLGIDVMGQFLVQFDFERGRLRLLNPDTPPDSDWGIPLDLEFIGGTPHLLVRLTDSISEHFMIDTGAPLIYLMQEKFGSLVREYDPATQYTIRPITKDTKDLSGAMMKTLRLGPLTYESIQIIEYPRSFLGMDFLRKHTSVTLDCLHRKLYLKPKPLDIPPSSSPDKPKAPDPNLL